MDKSTIIFGCMLSAIAGMGLMRGLGSGQHGHDSAVSVSSDSQPAGWTDAAASVPVTAQDPTWGSRSAPVTIVEFSNFRCGYCNKVRATMDSLKKKYGPDKLRIVWKHSPPPAAKPAHEAAIAAFEVGGSDAFWKFHDLAFENMRDQNPANFAKWAGQAGVDKAKFDAALKSGSAKGKIEQDVKLARSLGVRGTPGFFVNGVNLAGAQPLAKFEAEIDKQLAAANKLIASGTPKDQVYTKLTNLNKAKTPSKPDAKKPAAQDDKTVWKVPVVDTDPYKGSPDALVTIVEFSEFQCPFCSRVLPTTKKIMETYGNKVRIVWKDNPLPFHKRAMPASTLAREAMAQKGLEGFWKAHDLLFANQKKLEDSDLEGYAKELGLDVQKAKTAIATNAHKAPIVAAQELAGNVNASGTPHFFINGRRLVGAQPFEKFKSVIDEEIKKSEALVAKGIAKKALYAEIIKNGKEPPPPEQKAADEAPDNAPAKGAKDYVVTIHEYSDFQCPFCGRVNGTLKQVMANYGDRVRVVWRHKPLPFHQDAPLAHQAAQEAFAQQGSEGFWKFHDKLFASQKNPGIKRPQLDGFASELGLDVAKFKAALDSGKHKAFIEAENKASEALGIRGTPGFLVVPKGAKKGYFVSGAQPFNKFKKVIELALKQAGAPTDAQEGADDEAADKDEPAAAASVAPVVPAPVVPAPVVPVPAVRPPVVPRPVMPRPVVPKPVMPRPVVPKPVVPKPAPAGDPYE